MATVAEQWKEYQERYASKRAALTVAEAVYEYNVCKSRTMFYNLHRFAGISQASYEIRALRQALAEVSNGTDG